MAIKSNIDEVLKHLKGLEKQIPYAMSVALNNTAFDIKDDLVDGLALHLDRPTPFTERGFEVKKASKTNLKATIQAREIQSGYLRWAIEGGRRRPNRKAIPVPYQENLRLNKYGNMPRRKIQTLLARDDTFSGSINGVPGIYQRMKSGRVKLLIAYERSAQYEKRFPFRSIALKGFKARMEMNARKAVLHTIRTAR